MDTIAELFARSASDPTSLSLEDLQRIIDYYIEKRTMYKNTGAAVTPLAKPKPTLEDLFPGLKK